MAFFQAVMDFFQSIFNKNSPEVQRRLSRKKMESDARAMEPAMYKDGFLLPNFAEAVRQLYLNARPCADVFASTIGGQDIARSMRFEAQLVLTGFTEEEQRQVEGLSFASRKREAVESGETMGRVFDRQRKTLDGIVKAMNGPSFKRMDRDLNALRAFSDLCKFSFVTMLQIFDPNFIAASPSYEPSFSAQPLAQLSAALEDLYYQVSSLSITEAVARALVALAQMKNAGPLDEGREESLVGSVKRIAFIVSHILTPANLLLLIRLCKDDAAFEPRKAEYKDSPRQNFVTRMEASFKADGERIKNEVKDELVSSEIAELFDGAAMSAVSGYNAELDEKLRQNFPFSLTFVTPMQILKTFIVTYINDSLKALLNDIIIEGFFNNSDDKTEFSSTVYSALECSDKVQMFEAQFDRGKPFDSAVLDGYIRDSHKDEGFFQKLETAVVKSNAAAQRAIQESVNSLHALHVKLGELLADAKKPNCEIIQNLKVLMMSSRNRDNTDLVERQYPSWKIFFEIMKNYAIVSALPSRGGENSI